MNELNETQSFWVAPLLQSRDGVGEFHLLLEELKLYHGQFWAYFTTLVATFTHLRRQSTSYPSRPTDRRYCVLSSISLFLELGCPCQTTLAAEWRGWRARQPLSPMWET